MGRQINKIIKKEVIVIIMTVFTVCIILFMIPLFSSAATDGSGFVPLTSIPGVTDDTGDLGSFFNAIFKFGLTIAAILAVVMITVGGIQYMTTDSFTGKTEGKDKIQDAVTGLLIALLIWIILYTINPNLLKLDITAQKVGKDVEKRYNTSAIQTEDTSKKKDASEKGGGGLQPQTSN